MTRLKQSAYVYFVFLSIYVFYEYESISQWESHHIGAGLLLWVFGICTSALSAQYFLPWMWGKSIRNDSFDDLALFKKKYVYFVSLGSGVLKIGYTESPKARMKALQRKFGTVTVLAMWETSFPEECERIALKMTSQFYHYDGRKTEYRKMPTQDVKTFIDEFSKENSYPKDIVFKSI